MAEDVPEAEIEAPRKLLELDAPNIESQIHTAMRSCVPPSKQQADSLTFEGVRRLLENDLGLEAYALNVHKRFAKQCLLKCLEGVEDDKTHKNSGEGPEGSTEGPESKSIVKSHSAEEEEIMDDTPVLGLLKEQKPVKLETKEAEGNVDKMVPSEIMIKEAVRKRASYIKANSEKVTMAGLHQLLGKDLRLDKFALDPYKNLISHHIDEVLNSSEVSKPAKNAKKIVKKKSDNKATKKVSSEESSDASDQESDKEEKHEVKPRNHSVPKGKMQKEQNSLGSKKRKGPPEDTNMSSKKRIKPAKVTSNDNNDSGESGDDLSRSLPGKWAKKKEVSTPAYGKCVDHLKSIIKACGMSIPPHI